MGHLTRSRLLWGGTGILLTLLAVSLISPSLALERLNRDTPVISLVLLLMLAGAFYLAAVFPRKGTPPGRHRLLLIIATGVLMRLTMFWSTPVLEDDHYRYLWDGAVLAHGFNPYSYSPQEVRSENAAHVPDHLRQLADESGQIIERINYPWLRTIYPPLTQAAFALGHIMTPWSLTGWRILVLLLDGLTLYLLCTLLNRLGLSLSWLVIYWWNPLLVKEIYNSGHMEMVLLPLLLASLYWTTRGKYILASAALGLAVGAKFWPVLLAPVVWRRLLKDFKRLVPALAVLAGIGTAMCLPVFLSGLDYHSGFAAYGKSWEMNDALYMLILWVVRSGMDLFHITGNSQLATRLVVSAILVLCILWIVRRPEKSPEETGLRFLFVTGALFMLSPTQFPWYFLWFLPFLALCPRLSLLLLTPLLSFYYMRYWFQVRGIVHIYDNGIVWLEFAPVWCLLLWEWGRSRQSPRVAGDA